MFININIYVYVYIYRYTVSHKNGAVYSVPRKKVHNIFSNVFYKTRAILMKFGTQFPE